MFFLPAVFSHGSEFNASETEEQEQRTKEGILQNLRERDRRTYLRNLEKGEFDSDSNEDEGSEGVSQEENEDEEKNFKDHLMLPDDSSSDEDDGDNVSDDESDDPLPVLPTRPINTLTGVEEVEGVESFSHSESESEDDDDPFLEALKKSAETKNNVQTPPREAIEHAKVYVSDEIRSRSFVFGQ